MKFGIREICDVVLKAKSTMKVGKKTFYKDEPVLYFDTLKTSSLEGAATTVYAQGGRGNSRLVAWEGERTLTFTMEDALISAEGLSILSGAGLLDDSDNTFYQHITETIDGSNVLWDKVNNQIKIPVSEIPYLPTEDERGGNFAYVMFSLNGEIISEPYIPIHEYPDFNISANTQNIILEKEQKLRNKKNDLEELVSAMKMKTGSYNSIEQELVTLNDTLQVAINNQTKKQLELESLRQNLSEYAVYKTTDDSYLEDDLISGIYKIRLDNKTAAEADANQDPSNGDKAQAVIDAVILYNDIKQTVEDLVSKIREAIAELNQIDASINNDTTGYMALITNKSSQKATLKATLDADYDSKKILAGEISSLENDIVSLKKGARLPELRIAKEDLIRDLRASDSERYHPDCQFLNVDRDANQQVFEIKGLKREAFDSVVVDYYTERTGTGTRQLEITSDKFGGNFYLEASTLFRNQDGLDMPAEFVIPNCKIQSNFTFTMASSGDPSSFTFTIDAFPDYTRFDHSKKVQAVLQIIPVDSDKSGYRTQTEVSSDISKDLWSF